MIKGIKTILHKHLLRIFVILIKKGSLICVLCMAVSFYTGTARAQLRVTGVPVQGLVILDQQMDSFMLQHGIEGGVLVISRAGCIVYQCGFRWLEYFP